MTENPASAVVIEPYRTVANREHLIAGLDEIFFAASNTQSFANDDARAAFRMRWLGRYLDHDARWAYVARAASGEIAGYLVGSLDDPAATQRFSDVATIAQFKDVTRCYPAHLHVNLAAEFRGYGLGARLVEHFMRDVQAAGAPGVHVVTSRGARNVAFYTRLGFTERANAGEGAREVVLLARALE